MIKDYFDYTQAPLWVECKLSFLNKTALMLCKKTLAVNFFKISVN